MMLALIAIVILPLLVVTFFAFTHGAPLVNRLLSFIWQDPSERQRAVIAKRLKEIHVDGAVPEETAILLAAKEHNASEEELKSLLGIFSAGELVGIFTGKRTPLGALRNGIDRALKKRR